MGGEYFFVVHAINGTFMWQALIFLIHMFFTVLFTIGYKTQLSTFLTWFLLISLQEHNPYVGKSFIHFSTL